MNARANDNYNSLTVLAEGIGNHNTGKFGLTSTCSADFDNDGYDDIVIGAPFASPAGTMNAGEIYIFYGSDDFALKNISATRSNVKISGPTPDELLGSVLCSPGDIDGDSRDDLLVSAPGASGSSGKIYVFYAATINSGSELNSGSADLVILGSSAAEKFGSSMINIGDVNDDNVNDIMVGAPAGNRAYILYGPTYGASDRTIIIGPSGSQFGTSVAGGTDLNNDGIVDFVVGAPVGASSTGNKGQVYIYFGVGNFYLDNYIYKANNSITGYKDGDLFGQVIDTQLDLDKDAHFDIIVGAPGEDAVYIYYGSTLMEQYIHPYLWNMPNDPAYPVGFESGVYNDVGANKDVNTYGLGSGDDGWDWSGNVFGTSSGPDMDYIYGAFEESTPPYADADGLDYGNKSHLEVIVGRGNTGPGPNLNWWTTGMDSGAWGIEFKITGLMYDNLTKGANAGLELDWEAHDALKVFGNIGGTEEQCYVKLRFTGSSGSTYLGTNIGGDSTAELFYSESQGNLNSPFPSAKEHFETDITSLITGAGSYYLEMGARYDKSIWGQTKDANEGIVAFFDNVSINIETSPIMYSVKISGVSQSKFGLTLAVLNDLNADGHKELAIGSPYSNLGQNNAGAVYIIYGATNLRKQMNSNEADRILIGSVANGNFGYMISPGGNLNGDGYSEIIIGAPGHSMGLGKAIALTGASKPEITVTEPKGGLVAESELLISGEASDYENALDKFGVTFFYSSYVSGTNPQWKLIGQVLTPSTRGELTARAGTSHIYSTLWATTAVEDGLYRIKAKVIDNTYFESEAESEVFEVNNPDPPTVDILNPSQLLQTLSGTVTISASCSDPDNDLNFTVFYYSQDQTLWRYIGIDYSADNNIYELNWNTAELSDGEYYIKAFANDTRGLNAEAISVKFKVYNPGPPTLNFVQPELDSTLSGYAELIVIVKDKDGNIAEPGVTFSYSVERKNWSLIDTVFVINADGTYSIHWNTLNVDDGYYWLRAYVKDTTNLSAETILGPIKIDNPSPPLISLEMPRAPVMGKTELTAVCYDTDSELSSDGVTIFVTTDNQNWLTLGTIRSPTEGSSILSGFTYTLEWDTVNDDLPDNPNYRLRASVKDATGLENHTTIGPFEVNNPDPPSVQMDFPVDGSRLKGPVVIGAYASDPDGNIDIRGVAFYFSEDGKTWYLLDNAPVSESNSTLYQLDWDTAKLPDGKYKLKAMVVDRTSLSATTTVGITISNAKAESVLNFSSTFAYGLLMFIIIILILALILLLIILKRRKLKEQIADEDRRKDLAKQIRDELLTEQLRMYPILTGAGAGAREFPILPPFSHAPSPYGAAAEGATGERLFLPPYQGPVPAPGQSGAGPAAGAPVSGQSPQQAPSAAPSAAPGPYTATAGGVTGFSHPIVEQPYQPKAGLSPQEVATLQSEKAKRGEQDRIAPEQPGATGGGNK